MSNILIDKELCKGCGLCIRFCPKHIIVWGKTANKSGYIVPEQISEGGCTACKICGIMCPDSAIEVYRG